MVIHMKKTTLNIDETTMERLKAEAIRRKTTMGALVEAGIRRILTEGEAPAPAAGDLPPLPIANMGEPLVDIADREALYEAIDGERDERLYGTSPRALRGDARRVPERRELAVAEDVAPYDVGEGMQEGTDEA